jgi:predicted XRE-type DNA-binding protein
MKIRSVTHNNRRKAFEIRTPAKVWQFPYARVEPRPEVADPVVAAFADKELGNEGFTYVLRSGAQGTVHLDQVLEYNRDPGYLRDALLYKLTIEAQQRVAKSGLSKREIIRRLGTSATQFYRLLDQTNYRKSIDQLLSLLQVLGCEVDLRVRPKQSLSRRAA